MQLRRTPWILALLLGACAAQVVHRPEAVRAAADSIHADGILADIRTLSSDAFEGRAPGSRGEQLTVAYLTEQFRKLGLAPGNPDGSYRQAVPLVGLKARQTATLVAGGQRMHMRFPQDYVAVTRRVQPTVSLKDSDLVFVGYGVVAPEYGWDDYKGVDVRGKTIVMLVNDPAVPDPHDPSKLDDSMFGGKAMTYYGRWTYKYEIATEKGAAAAIIVHETGPAGYPWEVVANSWGGENFDLDRADGNQGRVAVEGWITEERARTLFRLAGQSFDDLKKAAVRKDFHPVPLKAKLSVTIHNRIRRVKSTNVMAKVEGSDPALKDQYVVYTAHWDHFGRNPNLKGDQIFNGALDNASGVAGLLEIAGAYRSLPTPPRRSVLFIAVTAEEQGLLGSKWYAEHPLYPLAKTVGEINMDGLDVWGRTRDVSVVGKGQSTLEDVLADEVKAQGRVVIAETEPEKGHYYRSDHFEFAKVGVPALYAGEGDQFIGQSAGYGKEKRDAYVANDYHKVSDEIKPDWDLSGAVEDLQLLFRVGLDVADADRMPEWKQGSEFKARREAMLQGAK